jgi:hypothetical protein
MNRKEIYTESKKFGLGQTGRTDFNETWLFEMPEGMGHFETFNALEYSIHDLINSGFTPLKINNNLYKIEGVNIVFYWIEKDKIILLGCELEKRPQGLVVIYTGKNPTIRGKAPYASDLYMNILNDQKQSIRLLSDVSLSDEGYKIWKKLFMGGNKVSIYDRELPGETFKSFDSIQEMDSYFQNDNRDYRRYQYILSPEGQILGEMRNYFNIRRYRELSGLNVED